MNAPRTRFNNVRAESPPTVATATRMASIDTGLAHLWFQLSISLQDPTCETITHASTRGVIATHIEANEGSNVGRVVRV